MKISSAVPAEATNTRGSNRWPALRRDDAATTRPAARMATSAAVLPVAITGTASASAVHTAATATAVNRAGATILSTTVDRRLVAHPTATIWSVTKTVPNTSVDDSWARVATAVASAATTARPAMRADRRMVTGQP